MVSRTANCISSLVFIAILACGAAHAQNVMKGVAESRTTTGSKIVEKMPIQGLLKVVTNSGEVMFLSTDRRFVFRGEMTDLWQGEAVGVESVGTVLNFERNGVNKDAISFSVGDGNTELTVFVAPECESCPDLVKAILADENIEDRKYRFVLLSSSPEGDLSNRLIWCSEDPSSALREIYVEGTVPRSLKAPASECDQFGLFLAQQAAFAFGIAQLPLVASADGQAVTGFTAALEKLQMVGE